MKKGDCMNFIDISSYQAQINLDALFKENPLDGVIIKATEATGYTNPYFKTWAEWLIENGKPWGVYHFLAGADAIAEAEFFYKTIKRYVGKCVPCADYEGEALHRGTAWLKEFLDEFYRLSGVRCLVYCSQSVTQEQNFTEIAKNHRLWMAQYADFSPVYGFKENPWHNGSVAPFNGWQMQQYTSCGVLNGWRSYLDLDKFYGTADDWQALCESRVEVKPISGLKAADPTVVSQVLMNRYGTGEERRQALIADGYDPDFVQKKINELYSVAAKVKPLVQNNIKYLNSIIKIVRGNEK